MTARSIVISGGSSGIGEALALHYAAPGTVLGLIGRDSGRLGRVAESCRAKGASVEEIALDVRERDRLAEWLVSFHGRHPVDLVVANAGVSFAEEPTRLAETQYDEIDINLFGAMNTVLPLVPAMAERGAGQIALISSLAALSPLADAAAYSASKAALLAYGLAMREKLRPRGLKVNVACPGFVSTAMGRSYKGWRPLEISAAEAARRIAGGLARDASVIAFPLPLVAMVRLSAFVPEAVSRLAMSRFRFTIERRG